MTSLFGNRVANVDGGDIFSKCSAQKNFAFLIHFRLLIRNQALSRKTSCIRATRNALHPLAPKRHAAKQEIQHPSLLQLLQGNLEARAQASC